MKTFLILAAILGASGVAIGAFGAHGLASTLQANGRASTFETAARYQMYHALALLAVAWVITMITAQGVNPMLISVAGWLIFVGTLIFSGSLYVLSIFDLRVMGAVAPVGGLLMVAGWICLGIAAASLAR